MIAQAVGAGTTELHVLRPRPGVDPRYLCYGVRSKHFLEEGVTAFQGVAGLQRVPGEFVADFEVADLDTHEQRKIADFLDDRVSRIDHIIAARRKQHARVRTLTVSSADALLSEYGDRQGPPLSAVATIIDTEHKTAPSVLGGGSWIAGTSALRDGAIVHAKLRETDANAFAEWTVRGAPVVGDVLLSREAPVGQVALLTDADPLVAIGQRVVLLKPLRTHLDSGYLRLVLMAGKLQEVITLASAGSLHPHLNMADISRLRVPAAPLDLQRSLGNQHSDLLDLDVSRRRQLQQSIAHLDAYKQSLITAAVTGELDVATAGSGIPG